MKFKNKITGEVVEISRIDINSALVSAQSRKRCYWTDIPGVTQPEDLKIVLKDVLDSPQKISQSVLGLQSPKMSRPCVMECALVE